MTEKESNKKDSTEFHLEKLKKLYLEGEEVLSTKYNNSRSFDKFIYTGYDWVDGEKFKKWITSCVLLLEQILNPENSILKDFKKSSGSATYNNAKDCNSILKSLIENIEDNTLRLNDHLFINTDFNLIIENIFTRFHRVAKQLKYRYSNRSTLKIKDEYDVQNLLNALLLLYFDDVRTEEWTPSYAGGSSRMDFLIKDINVVIETKMTRETLKDKQIADELIIDIKRYSKHPNCKILYCFVYDKNDLIKNPVGLEKDLSGNENDLEVKVLIFPKY